MQNSHNKFYVLLSITAVIWGAQPVLVKLTIQEWTPATVTVIRYFLLSGTLFLIMFFKKEKRLLPPPQCIVPLLFMGVCGIAINNVAQFSGLQYSTVTNATLISCTTPAITACFAVLFLKERLIPLQWLGILISLSGATFLISHGSLDVILHISFNYGDILFFIGQIAWAVYSLLSIRVMREMSVLATTAWAGLAGAIITAVYGYGTNTITLTPLSYPVVFCMIYIIWGGGVLAMLLWNISVKSAGPSRAAIFLNIMPLVGILCGVFFMHEEFRLKDLLGAAGILTGVYLTTQSEHIMHFLYGHVKHHSTAQRKV